MNLYFIDEDERDAKLIIDADTPEGVRFDGRRMHRAKFMSMVFNGASFVACDLRASTMDDAEAMRADFTSASLIGMDVRRAKLCESIFQKSRLRHTHFEHTDLSGADLSGAEIEETHFEGCDLRGAIMLADNLDHAYFERAIFDRHTVWPVAFRPLDKGAIEVKD